MDVLYLETDHDAVTKQVYTARRKVFTSMGAGSETHLFSTRAMASTFIATCCANRKWTLFSGMGHGAPDAFEGYVANHHVSNDIVNVPDTPRTMSYFIETIVHLYSCNTAIKLGPEMVKKRALAFIGYADFVSVASTAALEELFVCVSAVIDRSILANDRPAKTKAKADVEYQRVRTALTSVMSNATPTDVASFDLNYAALRGPWSGAQYGSY